MKRLLVVVAIAVALLVGCTALIAGMSGGKNTISAPTVVATEAVATEAVATEAVATEAVATEAPMPTDVPVKPTVTPPPVDAQPTCCKVCSKGKACGDSCISKDKTCHQQLGCACDG